MVKLTADLAVKAGRLKVRANIRKNQKQKNASVGGGEGESSAGEDKTKKTSRRKKKKEQWVQEGKLIVILGNVCV